MAISKLIFNNVTQMDVTTTTATEADVASGKTFLLADGTVGTGTASGGGGSPTIDSLSITPSENEQTFNSSSVDGYKPVTVDAISSTYVGSGIARKSSTDLTVSGATVTAPDGYYASNASKSVTTMTLPTAVSSSATSGYTSKATVSRSTSDQYINIAPGYNSAGGYYKINAVANGSATGPSSLSGNSAAVTTGTNTLTLTKTGVTTTPTVSAGYISSATASTATVALTASVTTKAAATITPSTSDQTIASGTYLTGTQTIKGDANLIAGNIKKDVTIFGTTGTYEGSGGGSGGDTKFVTGTFITSSSTSTNGTVSVNYSGSGYPIMLVIVVEGGCYDSSISPWYNSLTRYAVGQFIITKGDTSTTPGYTTSGSNNYGTVQLFYKNSTSSATSYTSTRAATANSYSSSNANGTSTTCVRWTGNKTISYRTGGGGSSSYGLLAGQTYRYYVYYSS